MPKYRNRQCAALPFRLVGSIPLVMLITSRETRRWIVPKGWLKKSLSARAMAAREAFEEAGVVGTISTAPIGGYCYLKRQPDSSAVLCNVAVFLLEVTQVLSEWPEMDQRERRWLPVAEAARLISDGGLRPLLWGLGGRITA